VPKAITQRWVNVIIYLDVTRLKIIGERDASATAERVLERLR
jgi:hypothetical protein